MGENFEAAKKKAIEDVAAATVALIRSTEGYDLFIPLLFILVLAVLYVYIDVSVLCVLRAHMCSYQYEINIVSAIIMIYLWVKSIRKLLIYPTITASENTCIIHFQLVFSVLVIHITNGTRQ